MEGFKTSTTKFKNQLLFDFKTSMNNWGILFTYPWVFDDVRFYHSGSKTDFLAGMREVYILYMVLKLLWNWYKIGVASDPHQAGTDKRLVLLVLPQVWGRPEW